MGLNLGSIGKFIGNAAAPAANAVASYKNAQKQNRLQELAAQQQAEKATQAKALNDALVNYHGAQADALRAPKPAPRDPVADHRANLMTDLELKPTPPVRDPVADHATNRDYDNAHQPPKTGNSSGANDPMTMQRVMTLQGHFNQDQVVKDAAQVATALQKIRASVTDPSAAGDMALLYGYMKLLDPNSVVRESEFANAAKSGSLPQQIQGFASKVVNGQRLAPEQRTDFVKRAEDVARSQKAQFGTTLKRYSDQASRHGVDPRDVVYDPFDGLLDDAPATTADPVAGTGAATRKQQLWDAAVAKHGQATVEAKAGPRP